MEGLPFILPPKYFVCEAYSNKTHKTKSKQVRQKISESSKIHITGTGRPIGLKDSAMFLS